MSQRLNRISLWCVPWFKTNGKQISGGQLHLHFFNCLYWYNATAFEFYKLPFKINKV
jgi:hypothetical protein